MEITIQLKFMAIIELVGANQLVTVKLNKKTYSLKTDKNGVVTLIIPNTLKPGTYTITATYKGQ